MPGLLAPGDCSALVAGWADERAFRKRVVMQQHGFGRGEYRYFGVPAAGAGRGAARRAVRAARAGRQPLGDAARASRPSSRTRSTPTSRSVTPPARRKPTPLVLRYEAGDYNCLHQDLYGAHVFPLQATVLLSEPGADFSGGEFLLVEQRPRAQSRGEVVPLARGDAVIFAVRERPRLGARGYHRAKLRHGVSTIRSGLRYTLGIILHDAGVSARGAHGRDHPADHEREVGAEQRPDDLAGQARLAATGSRSRPAR